MKKENREKIIKKIFDEEFGPNLSVDEICSEIDFTHQNGIKVVKEEVKPFYKKPIFMKLTYVCLLLVCVLSTFVITKKVTICDNDYFKTSDILDSEEIKYLNENGLKYSTYIEQVFFVNKEVKIYIFIAKKLGTKYCFVKSKYINRNENSIILKTYDSMYSLNDLNDLQNIGTLDNDNKISFSVEHNNIKNEYSIQCN